MLPHESTGQIPYKVFWELPARSLDRYKVFGCIIEVYIPKETHPPESMWDKRAKRAVYVGTDSRSGYEYWDLKNHRFSHTHNCTFFEDEFSIPNEFAVQYQHRRHGQHPIQTELPTRPSDMSDPIPHAPEIARPKSPDQPIFDTIVVERGPPSSTSPAPLESSAAKLPVNNKAAFEEALVGDDAPKWRAAMLDELQSIDNNKVWKLASLPSNRQALGSKWVLAIKCDTRGNIERYKVRLVGARVWSRIRIRLRRDVCPCNLNRQRPIIIHYCSTLSASWCRRLAYRL
jgi:hypothetical protein